MNYIEDKNTKYFTEFIECVKCLDCKGIKFQFGTDKIVFQTEQLTRKYFYNLILKISFDCILLEYSNYNKSLIQIVNKDAKVVLCPIFYTKNMRFNEPIKLYDFVFIGHLSDRRKLILNELLKYGVNVLIIQSEFDYHKKYKMICSAKCLVNIHVYEDYNVFEFARCAIPIYNGVRVISEICEGMEEEKLNPVNKYLLDRTKFAYYDQLVYTCMDTLHREVEKINYQELEEISEKEIKRINTELKEYDI
jgi:hypothetical protein